MFLIIYLLYINCCKNIGKLVKVIIAWPLGPFIKDDINQGEGVAKILFYYKAYFVKVMTKGEGV